MKIWEEIVQRLRNGEPLEEIRKDFRSASQFAEALRIYLQELAQEVERKRSASQQEDVKLKNAVAERKQIASEKNRMREEVNELREEGRALDSEVQRLRKEVDELKVDAANLERAGFTEKVRTELKQTWVKNEDEALSVLRDQQKALEIRSAVKHLMNQEAEVKSRVSSLEIKEKGVAKELASEENRLDKVRSEISVLKVLIEIVEAAFRRGYAPEDLISLFGWLERMEIQGQPKQSVQRLLEVFAEAKSLYNLKQQKSADEKKVKKLGETRSVLEADIEFLKVIAKRALEEQTESSKEAIASVAAQFREEAVRTTSELANLARMANEAVARNTHEPTRILYEMVQSPETIDKVPSHLIIALLQILVLWCERHFPVAEVGVVYDTNLNEFRFYDFAMPRYRISALIRLVAEGVLRLISRRSREASK